ncbi:MAG TPA: DUF1697 domain-containing protein [Bacteroidales bacterium]|nr:DUF1697 domain-containing protein [Bacteroidales bacterium]
MNTYVVFLRGVNVGGNMILKMDLLKKALLANQYEDIQTYINSGNILLRSMDDKHQLQNNMNHIIETRFGFSVGMIIKTRSELDEIVVKDPFDPVKEADNAKRAVLMLSEKINDARASAFVCEVKPEENYYLKGDLLYIYYHHGGGKSKFTNNYIEKKLKVISTARNWNTILKMTDMIRLSTVN